MSTHAAVSNPQSSDFIFDLKIFFHVINISAIPITNCLLGWLSVSLVVLLFEHVVVTIAL